MRSAGPEIAERYAGLGGLVASLPLTSVLAMIRLWSDTHDPVRIMAHSRATLWFVLPSLPMFWLIPGPLERGFGFWTALVIGCAVTILLYSAATWVLPKLVVVL